MDLQVSLTTDVSEDEEELVKLGTHPLLDHEDTKIENLQG